MDNGNNTSPHNGSRDALSELPRPAAGTTGVPLPTSEKVSGEGIVEIPTETVAEPVVEVLPATTLAEPELSAVLEESSPNNHKEESAGTIEDGLSSHSNGNSNINGARPARTKAPLQPHQKHTVAQALANGLPYHEIADLVRHTPQYIKRLSEQDPEIESLVDYYANQIIKGVIRHRFELLERLPKAYTVLDHALDDKDIRVRMKGMETVFKGATETTPQQQAASLELNVSNPEAQRALEQTTAGIKDLLEQIVSGELTAPPIEKHLRGGDSLPGPQDVKGHDSRPDA